MTSLLQIADEMSEVLRLLDEEMENTGGDVTDGSRGAALMEKVKGMDLKVRDKLDAYATVIRVMDLDSKVLKEEAGRLNERAESFVNRAKRLKSLLQFAMLQLGVRKLDGVKFSAAIQVHGGKQGLKFKVEDPEKVPERFVRIERSIDSEKVRMALEAGDEEAAKIAELLPRGESVRIR